MPVIGIAEVLVRPSFKGTQQAVGRELDGIADNAGVKAGKSSGSKMGKALGGALKYGALAAGGAAVAGLGVAMVKGFGRLQALEAARAKLTGIGNSAEDVTAIMKNASASVKGTAFGLGEAATVAATVVAAGIKPGAALEGVLKSVANSASASGVSMEEMGAIFSKVATSNKAQGDVLAQVNEKGIPLTATLAKQLGVTASEVETMASKGKIGFKEFEAAMTAASGTVAEEMGKTLPGAIDNTMASVGRIGANLLEGIYPQVQKFFAAAIVWLGPVEDAAKSLGVTLGSMLETVTNAAAGLYDVLIKGDFSKRFREAFKVEEDSKLVDFLFRIREGIQGARTEVVGGMTALVAAFTAGGRDITSSGFAGILEGIGSAGRIVWDAVQPLTDMAFVASATGWDTIKEIFSTVADTAGMLLPSLVSIGTSLGEASAKLSSAVWNVFLEVLNSVANILEATLVPALELVAGYMEENESLVQGLVGGFAAYGAVQSAMDWATEIWGLVQSGIEWVKNAIAIGASTVAKIKNIAETTYLMALYAKDSIVKAANTVILWAQVSGLMAVYYAQKLTSAATYKAAGAWVAQKVAMVASAVATKAVAAAQWLLNAAMTANPIGLVIAAIALLVGGFILAYNKLGWFKDGVNAVLSAVGSFFTWLWEKAVKPAFDAVLVAAGAVVAWFQNTLLPGIQTVFSAIGAVFMWYINTIVRPVFNAVFTVVNGFFMFFRGVAQLIVAVIVLHIAPAFQNFYNGVIKPVFDGIRNFIGMWWGNVQLIFTTTINFVKTVFSAAFTYLRDSVITPVFNFIKNSISIWWAATKFIFDTAINFIRTTFSAAFTFLRDFVITPVFNFIRNAITVWWTGVKFIFDTVAGFIRGTLSAAFTWFRDSVISPVFNGVRDTIRNVWEKGIKPVFDLLSNAIKKDVPNAFQKGVDGIKRIWETIKEISKKPVKFLIDTVINGGIIGAFNKLAGFIDPKGTIVKPLGKVVVPGFRNGGYTGKGRPGEFAGHVHRDEQVIKSPSRRSIEGAAPGFLDALNNHGASALAGFNGSGEPRLGLFGGFSKSIANAGRVFVRDRAAGWDVPGAIKAWQGVSGLKLAMGNGSPGINVTAAPMNVPGWGRGGYGYSTGPEVTVNSYQSGMAAGMKRAVVAHEIGHSLGLAHINNPASIMHPAVATAQWPTGFDVASMRMAYGAPGAGAKRYGPGDAGVSFPKSPFDGLAESLMGKLKSAFPGGGMFLDAAVGMAKMGIDKVLGFFKDIAGDIGKKIAGVAGSVLDGVKGILGFAGPAQPGAANGANLNPLLYDQGGILRPGLSSIMNATGKPEAIYTNEQNRALQALATRGMSPGGDTWNVQLPERASVGELMDAVSFKQRVNSRGGARR